MRRHALVDSPLGPLLLVAAGSAVAGLYMEQHRHAPGASTHGPRDDGALPALRGQLAAYFAGELEEFDVAVDAPGTPFQQRVWAALQTIPYGQTRSYGELAAHLGQPTASRAVGLANGRNPVSIVVPCHRVVGSSGSLTGYGGGVDRKRWLLDHEQRKSQLFGRVD